MYVFKNNPTNCSHGMTILIIFQNKYFKYFHLFTKFILINVSKSILSTVLTDYIINSITSVTLFSSASINTTSCTSRLMQYKLKLCECEDQESRISIYKNI
jgi:hypothetical protein